MPLESVAVVAVIEIVLGLVAYGALAHVIGSGVGALVSAALDFDGAKAAAT